MPDTTLYEMALEIAELPNLAARRQELCLELFTEIQDPTHKLHHLLPPVKSQSHNLRCKNKYQVPKVVTDGAKYCFINWCLFNLQ